MSEVLAIRTKLGLSQTAFAKFIGVNQSTVSRWESGREEPTDLNMAGIRAKAAEYTAPEQAA